MVPEGEERQTGITTTSTQDDDSIDENSRRLKTRLFAASLLDLACVTAVLCTNGVRNGVHTWNSPVWPLLPLLLNRLTELLALGFGHIYLTIPAAQLFLAVINVVLVLQRLPCATSQLACMPVIMAFCLLALEVLLAVLALVWVNLAACRAWAAAFAPELRGSASITPVDERPFSVHPPRPPAPAAQDPWAAEASPPKEPARQYVTVMQPSEGSFAVAIVVDATGAGPFHPPPQ
ncbi:hypothetical protein WJX81_007656 [Elliptochloris bilobata]|uniref:Uncharacterized protein n=1 Tax=Elliptochloris bilobata TaxID=381761 RepID=A0AAW1RCX4_9CHLO